LLRASLELVSERDENAFVENACALFAKIDALLAQLASIEHRIHLQINHRRSLPALPRGIDEPQAKEFARLQLERELASPDLAYPRVNALFSPVIVDQQVLAWLGASEPKPGVHPVAVVPVVRLDEDTATTTLKPLEGPDLLWIQVLVHSQGQNSIAEICRSLRWSMDDFRARCAWVTGWAPYMLEFHWVPGTGPTG
jgi:hypothetical protein